MNLLHYQMPIILYLSTSTWVTGGVLWNLRNLEFNLVFTPPQLPARFIEDNWDKDRWNLAADDLVSRNVFWHKISRSFEFNFPSQTFLKWVQQHSQTLVSNVSEDVVIDTLAIGYSYRRLWRRSSVVGYNICGRRTWLQLAVWLWFLFYFLFCAKQSKLTCLFL